MTMEGGFYANQSTKISKNQSQDHAEFRSLEIVCRWLTNNGWDCLVPIFQKHDIHSLRFLNLTLFALNDLIPDSILDSSDRRRLADAIQALKSECPPYSKSMEYLVPNPGKTIQCAVTIHDADPTISQPLIPKRTSSCEPDAAKILNNLNVNVPIIKQFSTMGILGTSTEEHESLKELFQGPIVYRMPQPRPFPDRSSGQSPPPVMPFPDPNRPWKRDHQDAHFLEKLPSQTPMGHMHRIHITTNGDTYEALDITDTRNADMIKKVILDRVKIIEDYQYYCFFHENGDYPDRPLTDVELISICRSSDKNRINRIMVKANATTRQESKQFPYDPIHHQMRPHPPLHAATAESYNINRNYDKRTSLYSCSSRETSSPIFINRLADIFRRPLQSPNILSPNSCNTSTSQSTLNGKKSFNLISPVTYTQPQMWAVPPQKTQTPTQNDHGGKENELIETPVLSRAEPGSTESTSDVAVSSMSSNSTDYYDACSPSRYGTPRSLPSAGQSNPRRVVLEDAESPFTRENSADQQPDARGNGSTSDDGIRRISLRDDQDDKPARPALQVRISPDPQVEVFSSTTSYHTARPLSPFSPVSDREATNGDRPSWAERPPVEKLFRHIDDYLSGHDLDTEIITYPPEESTSTQSSRWRLAHRKSVRAVANEALGNWESALKAIRANKIIRRKSTGVWNRQVEQMKPNQQKHRGPTPKSAIGDDPIDKTAPTKMKWMKGALIGKGGYGRVYHAFNIEAGEWIAVKEVDLPTTISDMRNEHLCKAAEDMFGEIQLLANLDHENIVQYLGYHEDTKDGHLYLFLEYVPGGSIASCLKRHGKFEEVLVKYFTRQILCGIEYIHEKNILHRDIKADNILVDLNGCCKIADFGLSKITGKEKVYEDNPNSGMKGTVYWMAPEMVKGPRSGKADIWSVGCTVIEMLTGERPWLNTETLAAIYHLGKRKHPPIPPGISDDAAEFLSQCFIIDPTHRPTATQLLEHRFVRHDRTFQFNDYMIYANKRGSEMKQHPHRHHHHHHHHRHHRHDIFS